VSTKPTTSQNSKAAEPVNAFLVELSVLQVRTEAIARLRSGVLVKQLSGLDKNSGELRAKVLNLMNQIEASFRIIRRKLGS
jgi:hypothetical protein